MATLAELKEELEYAQAKVERLHQEIADYSGDDYPVGTIATRGETDHPFPYLIKVSSVHADLGFSGEIHAEYRKSDEPVWVSMHGDMSGRTFKTLADAERGHWGTFEVVYEP